MTRRQSTLSYSDPSRQMRNVVFIGDELERRSTRFLLPSGAATMYEPCVTVNP